MLRFDTLESAGLRVAAMSGHAEGDCVLAPSSEANRRAFMALLGLDPECLACPKQVHGIKVAIARTEDAGRGAFGAENAIGNADAIVTNAHGLPIGITVADCVPIALYDPVHRAIGLAHAGRDGTMQHIATETVRAMAHYYGTRPTDLFAVIGPSAGPCCYEVSEELAAAFIASDGPTNGRYLDLWEANRQQLVAAGLSAANVQVSGCCTICTDAYFSYRREKTAARNLLVLSL